MRDQSFSTVFAVICFPQRRPDHACAAKPIIVPCSGVYALGGGCGKLAIDAVTLSICSEKRQVTGQPEIKFWALSPALVAPSVWTRAIRQIQSQWI